MSAPIDRPVVEVYRANVEDWHPFPWRFRITWKGRTHAFVGMPNQCASKREAAARASWRVRWMLDGSYERRYSTALLGGAS